MKKKFFQKIITSLLIMALAFSPLLNSLTVFAEDEAIITVENGDVVIEIDLVNPELTEAGQADRPADTYTLFTRDFGNRSTLTNEWGVEVVVSDGVVTYVSESFSGNNQIPADGYVISVIDSPDNTRRDELRESFNVGDEIVLTGITLPEVSEEDEEIEEEVSEPEGIGLVKNQDNQQVVVDHMNVTRNAPMIVLYTAQFGQKTGTNPWGREMIVDLNDQEELEVIGFRDLGEGDDSGSEIPRWGFVLSSFGEPYRSYLEEGTIFNIGDIITLEDINLIQLDNEQAFDFVTINPTPETNPAGVEDAEAGEYFPGLRGTDQLLIYTAAWGEETTGTNEYGYEVTVEGSLADGTIVGVGGNNSYIPENGYVLSGHGTGASFLIANASVGSQVIINEETQEVTIKTTPNSLISNAQALLELAQSRYQERVAGLYDADLVGAKSALDTAEAYYSEAEQLLDQLSSEEIAHADQIEFLTKLDEVEKYSNLAFYRTFESRQVEGRGIWHRPAEKSLAEVVDHLDQLKAANFNLIFIETWNDGYSITESSHELIGMQPRIAGGDYGEYQDILEAYVEEGKKRGIEVHAWVQNYRVGHQGNTPSSPIIEAKPEWALIHHNDSIYTPHENNYVFMDPAIPDVQDFLIDYYKELIGNYDIQGIQLDYIRYPVGHYRSDSGYGEYSVNAFKDLHDLDQDEDLRTLLDRDENPELVEAWNNWKTNHVTSFVERSYNELKELDPDLVFSTAIFENIADSIGTKNQDWPTWVQEGWVDLTSPMAYYRDETTVANSVDSMVELVEGMALNYAGIAPTYMGLADQANATQTHAAQLGQAQGSAIFASQNVLNLAHIQEVLRESTYREEAVLPHGDLQLVLETGLDELIDRMERIYLPQDTMTEADLVELQNTFNQLKANDLDTSNAVKEVAEELLTLSGQADTWFDAPANDRFKESMDYLAHILNVRALRMDLADETDQVDPEKPEEPQEPEEPEEPVVPEEPQDPVEPQEPQEPVDPEVPEEPQPDSGEESEDEVINDNGDDNENEPVTDNEDEELSDEEGETLPKTATRTFNYLFIAILFLLLGGSLLYWRKKRA